MAHRVANEKHLGLAYGCDDSLGEANRLLKNPQGLTVAKHGLATIYTRLCMRISGAG